MLTVKSQAGGFHQSETRGLRHICAVRSRDSEVGGQTGAA